MNRYLTVDPVCLHRYYFQAFLPLLKIAANADRDKPMSCSRSAIINISTGVASISENSSGGNYAYRASKVGSSLLEGLLHNIQLQSLINTNVMSIENRPRGYKTFFYAQLN